MSLLQSSDHASLPDDLVEEPPRRGDILRISINLQYVVVVVLDVVACIVYGLCVLCVCALPLCGVRGMLCVVCCVLRVVCCVLCVLCFGMCVARCVLRVVCCALCLDVVVCIVYGLCVLCVVCCVFWYV